MKIPCVLIVDFTESIGPLFEKYLLNHGFKAIRASSFEQIKSDCKEGRVDLIVWGLVPERIEDVEFLATLSQSFSNIPVLVMSTFSEMEDLLPINLRSNNTLRFFSVPLQLQTMLNTIQTELESVVESSSVRRPTVLIIDDESSVCNTISQYFSRNNFQVEKADNGLIGLKKCESNHIDLVITDLCMPEMDGFEYLMHLHFKFPKMIAYAITGHELPGVECNNNKIECFGARRVFSKPLCLADLCNAAKEDIKLNKSR